MRRSSRAASPLRTSCHVPRNQRAAYQSTLAFLDWEMSQPRVWRKNAYDRVEQLIDNHSLKLRRIGWKLVEGERIVTRDGPLALGTLCQRGKAHTVLGIAHEFIDW